MILFKKKILKVINKVSCVYEILIILICVINIVYVSMNLLRFNVMRIYTK